MLKTERLRGIILAAIMTVPSLSCKDRRSYPAPAVAEKQKVEPPELSPVRQVPPTPSQCAEVLNQHFDSGHGMWTRLRLICREHDGKTGYYSWDTADYNSPHFWQRDYEMKAPLK